MDSERRATVKAGPEPPKASGGEGRVPFALKIIIGFLLALSVCQIVMILRSAIVLEELRREVLLQFLLRGLLSFLALLLAVQLMLRIPYGRACALVLLVGFPAVNALQFVLFPLKWQTLGGTGRLEEFARTATLLLVAALLFAPSVHRYMTGGDQPSLPQRGADSPARH